MKRFQIQTLLHGSNKSRPISSVSLWIWDAWRHAGGVFYGSAVQDKIPAALCKDSFLTGSPKNILNFFGKSERSQQLTADRCHELQVEGGKEEVWLPLVYFCLFVSGRGLRALGHRWHCMTSCKSAVWIFFGLTDDSLDKNRRLDVILVPPVSSRHSEDFVFSYLFISLTPHASADPSTLPPSIPPGCPSIVCMHDMWLFITQSCQTFRQTSKLSLWLFCLWPLGCRLVLRSKVWANVKFSGSSLSWQHANVCYLKLVKGKLTGCAEAPWCQRPRLQKQNWNSSDLRSSYVWLFLRHSVFISPHSTLIIKLGHN